MALAPRTPKIGLALGSGSARGWAHMGVLKALDDAGIKPDVVCGSSIGALVGAAYAAGELDRFAEWTQTLNMRSVFGFMDFKLSGGMLKGEKLIDFWRRNFVDFDIESSAIPFAAVATDLHSGAEVWLREGSMADAVRASIALPGLFTPVQRGGRLLVDGGLVNPVPASLARAMGADIVIAVDLNADLIQRHMRPLGVVAPVSDAAGALDAAEAQGEVVAAQNAVWLERLRGWMPGPRSPDVLSSAQMPSLLDVVMTSVNIMQMRITRSRMAGDPPELVIAPRLAHLGLLDFHRAKEAMEEGYAATQAALPGLQHFGWKAVQS
ncbi:patatin-like phospholipase family protein [Comamonas jiangduensis]|uniref:patatin-like phospholipase family protein n=1 Tax=Comamonas jiangduensis TaxID=1194168 RepID=UPI0024E1834F|nr:patatin-like phospholipase family protein [Comamonas jiangduensis]